MPDDPQVQFALAAISALALVSATSLCASGCLDRQKRSRPRLSRALCVAGLSTAWWASSMSIVLLNRFLFGFMGKRFSYPVTITTAHMAVKGLLAAFAVLVSGAYSSPELSLLSCPARTRTRLSRLVDAHRLTGRAAVVFLLPLGLSTAVDVWMSNLSLKYVDVSVYTTTKSTALLFNLALSLLFGLIKRPSPLLIIAVIGLAAGVIMSSLKPAGADPVGIACALAAACCSALRWVVSERFFARENARPNVLVLLALIGPITVGCLLPPMAVEVADIVATRPFQSASDAEVLVGAMLGGGLLAFVLVLTELQLVALTSALTLNVIGHAKDAVVVLLSVAVFHDDLSLLNWAGVALTIASTTAYSAIKARAQGGPGAAGSGTAGAAHSPGAGSVRGSEGSAKGGKGGRGRSKSGKWGGGGGGSGRASSIAFSSDGVDTTTMAVSTAGFGGGGGGGGRSSSGAMGGQRSTFVRLDLDSDDDDEDEEEDEAGALLRPPPPATPTPPGVVAAAPGQSAARREHLSARDAELDDEELERELSAAAGGAGAAGAGAAPVSPPRGGRQHAGKKPLGGGDEDAGVLDFSPGVQASLARSFVV
jgi:solute carrier family 35, member C2